MESFIKNFFIDGFETGDYTYGFIHIISISFLIFLVTIFLILYHQKDEQFIRDKMKPLAYLTLIIYLLRRIITVNQGQNILQTFWPFYLCNINTVFISLYIILDVKKGQDFFYITGLLGGLVTFALPDGIYNDRYLTFSIIDSILSHYIIVFVPLVLLISQKYIIKFKNLLYVFIGLIITVINSEIIQKLLFKTTNDYLFFRGDIPFTIPNIPQFFIVSSLAIIFVFSLYGLDKLYLTTKENN